MALGVYIHYPFCQRICPFCDFAVIRKSWRERGGGVEETYADAVVTELNLRANSYNTEAVDSIYFGGGTPSLAAPRYFESTLTAIRDHFTLTEDVEITVEVDPHTLGIDDLRTLKSLGVNRLSMGFQALGDNLLTALGRGYGVDANEALYHHAVKAGFDNLSADLIFGIPAQTPESWQRHLKRLTQFPLLKHISLYLLSHPQDGRFDRHIKRLDLQLSSESDQVAMFQYAQKTLPNLGFHHYEISNYAKQGFPSRHNTGVWQGNPYLGLGLSAHSYLPGRLEQGELLEPYQRQWNSRSLKTYLNDIQQGITRRVNCYEELTRNQTEHEFFILGLRQRRGIEKARYQAVFGERTKQYQNVIDKYGDMGLIVSNDDHFALTDQGVILSNEILSDFAL